MYDTGRITDSKLRRRLRAQRAAAWALFQRAPNPKYGTGSSAHGSTNSTRTRTPLVATVSTASNDDPTTPAQLADIATPDVAVLQPHLVDTGSSDDEDAADDAQLQLVVTESSDDEAAGEADYDAYRRGEDEDKYEYPSSNDDCADNYDAEPEDDLVVFKRELAEAKVQHRITNAGMDAMLRIMRKIEPRLPKDSRTLVKPQAGIELKLLAGGQYYHFGLEQQVKADRCNDRGLVNGFQLQLQVNFDGLPLYKSKNNSVWPILGLLKNVKHASVFVIGIFYGYNKPNSIEVYLQEFLDEYQRLSQNGFLLNNVHVTIALHSVVCDAPARAMIKCVKGHSGYSSCDKCTEHGINYCRRIVFPQLTAPKRTDASFQLQHDVGHHHGVSPFLRIGVGK